MWRNKRISPTVGQRFLLALDEREFAHQLHQCYVCEGSTPFFKIIAYFPPLLGKPRVSPADGIHSQRLVSDSNGHEDRIVHCSSIVQLTISDFWKNSRSAMLYTYQNPHLFSHISSSCQSNHNPPVVYSSPSNPKKYPNYPHVR